MVGDVLEEEKVFIATGYRQGSGFACFKRYLGDFLSNEEGHRKKTPTNCSAVFRFLRIG
jgi:hypothetical protein